MLCANHFIGNMTVLRKRDRKSNTLARPAESYLRSRIVLVQYSAVNRCYLLVSRAPKLYRDPHPATNLPKRAGSVILRLNEVRASVRDYVRLTQAFDRRMLLDRSSFVPRTNV